MRFLRHLELPSLPRLSRDGWRDFRRNLKSNIPDLPTRESIRESLHARRGTRILPPLPKPPSPKEVLEWVKEKQAEKFWYALPALPSPRLVKEWAQERRNRRRWLVGWIIVIALAPVAWVAAPKIAHAVKGWQARRLAHQAHDSIEREKWDQAGVALRGAFQLRSDEPDVWLAYAQLLSRSGQGPLALEWWQKISATRPLTIQEHRDYATAALTARELDIATEQIAPLLSQKDKTPFDHLLAGQLSTLRGYTASAITNAQNALANTSANQHETVAAILIILANTEIGSEANNLALDQLFKIAQDDSNPASAEALAILAQQHASARLTAASSEPLRISVPERVGTPLTVRDIANRLKGSPFSTAYQKILSLELRAQLEPAKEDELVAEAIQAYAHSDDSTLISLVAWLYSRRRFESILSVLPLERASVRRELLMEYIDALAGLGRMSDVKKTLLADYPVIDQTFQHMYLAVVRADLKETAGVVNEWRRALDAADTPYKLFALAEYAEKHRAFDIADAAYVQLITRQPGLRAAYLGRLKLLITAGETAKAHDLTELIGQRWPDDLSTRLQGTYMQLLLGTSIDEIRKTEEEAESIAQRTPWHIGVRMTLALARLKLGKNAAALAAVSELKEGEPMASGPLAVRAAALAANGWLQKATQEAEKLNTALLLPEERALIAPLLPRQ